MNSEDDIVGALSKIDIMNAIAVRGEAAIDEIMDTPVKVPSIYLKGDMHEIF